MNETTTTTGAHVCALQDAIREALPPERRHLLNDLDEATGIGICDAQELLIRTLMAHLPHRADEILGAWEHISVGTPDPSLRCCSAKRIMI
jgi:hypothetical protein